MHIMLYQLHHVRNKDCGVWKCFEKHLVSRANNIYSLLSVRLELSVADSIKQHHVYSVRTIKIFPHEII